jgi:hypothetical protein
MRLDPRGCLLTLALAISIAACGEDDSSPPPPDPSPPDEEQIAATVNDFFAALVEDDGDLACSYLTERGQRFMHTVARRQFPTQVGEDADCEAVVAITAEYLADEDVRSTADYTYTAAGVSIEESGRKAYAQCEFRGSVFVRRSGDGWLVDLPGCID